MSAEVRFARVPGWEMFRVVVDGTEIGTIHQPDCGRYQGCWVLDDDLLTRYGRATPWVGNRSHMMAIIRRQEAARAARDAAA